MRRIALALLLAIAAAAPALAADPIAPGEITPDDATIDPALLKVSTMKTPEVLNAKPSGFWTSNRPAKDGAYYYWMMGVGAAVSATVGLIALIVIRRSGRQPAPTA